MTFSKSDFHPKKEHSRSYVTDEGQIYKGLCSWINIAINLLFGQKPEHIRHYHVVLFPAYQ